MPVVQVHQAVLPHRAALHAVEDRPVGEPLELVALKLHHHSLGVGSGGDLHRVPGGRRGDALGDAVERVLAAAVLRPAGVVDIDIDHVRREARGRHTEHRSANE